MAQGKIVLDRDVTAVLDVARIDGTSVVLVGQLPRDLYVKVNKALEALGGKWDRKAKAHLFEYDPADAINNALMTGSVTDTAKELDFFETPAEVADMILDLLDIQPWHTILEPSAGEGAIVRQMRQRGITQKIHACEIDEKRASKLAGPNIHIFHGDFLRFYPEMLYDRIPANPPFSKRLDLAHVAHMWELLRPNGRLCSVMPSSIKFRRDAKAQAFLDIFPHNSYEIIDLPEGSFKASGTGVNTVLFLAERPS